MYTLRAPITATEFSQYYHLRWNILRKPWKQVHGSEQDTQEQYAIHRMIIDEYDKILAVGRLEKVTVHQGQIRFMAVDHSAQGEGLGKKIINALEQKAKQIGMNEIVLNARESAIGFYQKLGYELHGYSHTLYDDVKHYGMAKKLTALVQHKATEAQMLQTLWHNTIPLSKAMDLQINFYDGLTLITTCNADFNKNLHHTMFAGSIYTLATLTGWGWVYFALKEQQQKNTSIDGDIVLAEANIRYHSPIKGLAYGQVIAQDVSGKFDNVVQGKNARIKLTVHIYCGDNVAATFTGSYFILPTSKNNNEKINA